MSKALCSGLNEEQLASLANKLKGLLDSGPKLIQVKLQELIDNSDQYDLAKVTSDLQGFCQPCIMCGYIVDLAILDADLICEGCNQEDENDLYGFDDDDFDEDDLRDEWEDWEGDDWEDDEDYF